MAIEFRVICHRGLVYVRYSGFLEIEESLKAFKRYGQMPEARMGLRQLVDFSEITGFETDYLRIFELQMKKAEVFANSEDQTIIIYYAPTPIAQQVARLACRSWEPVPGIVASIVSSEQQALDILGIEGASFDAFKTDVA